MDAVLIGMEPSLRWWARTRSEAAAKIAAGFRNFMWSPEDFILHYGSHRRLITDHQTCASAFSGSGLMDGQLGMIFAPVPGTT